MLIETREETIVTRSLVLTISEPEINEALVDPKKLVRQLRAERNKWYKRQTLGQSKKQREDVTAEAKPKRGRPAKAVELVACPGCGETFNAKGIGPHKRGCAKYQIKKAAKTLPTDN